VTKDQAYNLFEQMIAQASDELVKFTVQAPLSIEHKADKSAVTECDKKVDAKLSELATKAGLQVVSEEGEHVLDIVKSGNYMTIDPIDGTLGYIENVNYALENGGIEQFIKKDLGAEHDFGLLLGIVENGLPRFGACYNFITKEKILIDAESKDNFVRENNIRNYTQENVVYLDQRFIDDPITNELISLADTVSIKQATLGFKSLYTLINSHKNAVTVHRVQSAGLWDIMPAAVAARVFGGEIYDDTGKPLEFESYILLPGKGATIIKGDKFKFVLNKLNAHD
jgi:3'-phosphoadenosine 5'-phosphosulfate (PAPS) 3'-phosphatase